MCGVRETKRKVSFSDSEPEVRCIDRLEGSSSKEQFWYQPYDYKRFKNEKSKEKRSRCPADTTLAEISEDLCYMNVLRAEYDSSYEISPMFCCMLLT